MGEEPWRIKTVGNPGLDRLRCERPVPMKKLIKSAGPAAAKNYVILIYHAVSSGLKVAPQEFSLCIESCLATGLDIFIGAPNSDPGYGELLKITQRYAKNPQVHLYNNLPRSEFVSLLKGAKAIVGNSSLGILEASFIGVPCVNVGQRQRERLAGVNVQFVDANAHDVMQALTRALFDKKYRAQVKKAKSPYGDGHMVEKAMKFIRALPSRQRLLDKRITY
jgi:GDP/UDP-N,N'-diacetylbacillosamine 2-epimerase (hydrolysing)